MYVKNIQVCVRYHEEFHHAVVCIPNIGLTVLLLAQALFEHPSPRYRESSALLRFLAIRTVPDTLKQ